MGPEPEKMEKKDCDCGICNFCNGAAIEQAVTPSLTERLHGPFKKGIENLVNRESMENGSNTPDFILAEFLIGCLENFNKAVVTRNDWHGTIIVEDSYNEKQLMKINKLEAEVSRLTEENEKLKDRQRQSCMDCEEKIALENDQLRARIAELEGLCENSCAIADERFELEKANKKFEARISAIEKFLVEKNAFAVQNGKVISEFKPGGECVPIEKGEGDG